MKGLAQEVISTPESSDKYLSITGLSADGIGHLKTCPLITVEFVLLSTKIVFASRIVHQRGETIRIRFPRQIYNVERRKAMRHDTSETFPAFMELSFLKETGEDPMLCRPAFPQYKHLESMVRIENLSLGGVCFTSRFPELIGQIQLGFRDEHAMIQLPMQDRTKAPVIVRWIKTVRQETPNDSGVSYKFGCQFTDTPEELLRSIKLYTQQLNSEKAI